jgi:hypothetical protein
MNAIIIFRSVHDHSFDWRAAGQVIPTGSIPMEVTRVDGDRATTVALHQFAADDPWTREIVRVRNEAIDDLAAAGVW